MIPDTHVESQSTDDEQTAPIDEDQEFEAEYVTSDSNADFMNSAAAVVATGSVDFPALRDEYTHLWAELGIRRERLPEVDRIIDRLLGNEERYRAVERSTGVPWYVVGTIHNLEASGNFSKHLHNGDPLTARTVNVPAGRPAAGRPPFTWEQSAADALAFHRLTQVTDWTVERMAYEFERYNGFGYRQYHPQVKSPYLWSFSNHYTSGKYVADGRWSETAVSQQCGAMVLLKRLKEMGHLDLRLSRIAAAGTSPELQTFARDADAAAAVRAARPVESQLNEGPGIFGYYSASKRYGTAATIAALKEVGRIWSLRHTAPRVGVGDISLRGGGDIDGHASHETGRDVDLRPIKADGTEGPVTWTQGSYSRSLTQELIDIIYANGVVNVKVIGFNDPGVQGCVNWVNHDNHLHVRFYFDDESPGYPLVQLGVNNSPPVRECQRRLNNWKRMRGDTDPLIPDGDFGQSTLKAVRDFQATMGLVVDGKVGNGTWKRTLDYLVSDDDARIAENNDIADEIGDGVGRMANFSRSFPTDVRSDPRPVLFPGVTGDAVGRLQTILRALHFDVEIDLTYGPATELAIKVFQRDHGLRADGVVGPLTWDALERATTPDGELPERYWPVGRGHVITSPWGPRAGGFHYGTDFGWPGGSAGKPVYAVQSGTVKYSGAAQGYGGPDPAGWLVITSTAAEGSGTAEYGHIVREVANGEHVTAGQRIAHVNPNRQTNGGVPPHLHLSVMPRGYDRGEKINPVAWLGNALSPEPVPLAPRAVMLT